MEKKKTKKIKIDISGQLLSHQDTETGVGTHTHTRKRKRKW